MSDPLPLSERLATQIKQEGPLTFRDWMEACLYDPDQGYYMRPGRKTGPGEDADFATSPTLHPFLGQAVAAEIRAAWQAAGRPAEWPVHEFGGGEGDLARSALAALDDVPVTWTHIERSPTHRAAQEHEGVSWAQEVPAGTHGVVIAHEFLDALPFHLLERRKGNWAEVRVGDGETFGIPTPAAVDAAPLGVPDGHRVAAMVDARAWVQDMARRVRGLVLVIDYGDDHVWRRSRDGTVRTFAAHADAGSPLDDPGTKDITASIDFALVRAWAQQAGFETDATTSQEQFLLDHGVLEALNAQPRDTPEEASAYLRLRQMLLPTAMGGAFCVQRLWKR